MTFHCSYQALKKLMERRENFIYIHEVELPAATMFTRSSAMYGIACVFAKAVA